MWQQLFLVFIAVSVTWTNVPVVFAEGGACVLPPYPTNGSYSVFGDSSARPGQTLESYVLKVTCDPGFQLVGYDVLTCSQGSDPDDLPECIQYCQMKSTNILSCNAQPTCYFQRPSGPEGGGGLYSECGMTGPVYLEVVSGGTPAHHEEMPWHTGIYKKTFEPFMQICGGSLVSHKVVITAAHCFWNDLQKQLPAENFAVAVGKIYRPWNDPHDKLVQKSDVREIKMPPRFFGSAANFQEDLALVVVQSAFIFSNAVRPVCLDFDYNFDAQQLTSGALGKVAGWGLVSEDGRPAPTLQVAQIPYIGIEECVAGASPNFLSFLSGDKICAGYTNGTAVCKGDSGGGLTFPAPAESPEDGVRYYLRGVISVAPRTEHLCNVYHWATFTHVLKHQHFIQTLLNLEAVIEPTPAATPSKLQYADLRV